MLDNWHRNRPNRTNENNETSARGGTSEQAEADTDILGIVYPNRIYVGRCMDSALILLVALSYSDRAELAFGGVLAIGGASERTKERERERCVVAFNGGSFIPLHSPFLPFPLASFVSFLRRT